MVLLAVIDITSLISIKLNKIFNIFNILMKPKDLSLIAGVEPDLFYIHLPESVLRLTA